MVPNPGAYGPVVNTSRHEVLVVMKGAPAIVNTTKTLKQLVSQHPRLFSLAASRHFCRTLEL